MKKYLRPVVTVVILVMTVATFAYYLARHPATVQQIKHTPPLILVLLVLLYFVVFGAYALVTRFSLRLYNKHMGAQENFLFNAYSSLINFFGPGQSGPIFRGAYLKKRHNLGVKSYLFALLIYFAFYGIISAMMAVIGTRPWWQTLIVVSGAAAGSYVILKWYKKRSSADSGKALLSPRNLGLLFAATLLQLTAQAVIFGIELHHTGAHVSIGQVLAYTGVANFSLFVALTPGAIGIRESFLLFSQQLHHINSNTIVTASLIDRGAYLVFLGALFVLTIALHAKDKLRVKQLDIT